MESAHIFRDSFFFLPPPRLISTRLFFSPDHSHTHPYSLALTLFSVEIAFERALQQKRTHSMPHSHPNYLFFSNCFLFLLKNKIKMRMLFGALWRPCQGKGTVSRLRQWRLRTHYTQEASHAVKCSDGGEPKASHWNSECKGNTFL